MSDKTYNAYPVAVEIYDDDSILVATVTADSGSTANVEIKAAVNATHWVDISAEIHAALKAMRLQGEG